MKSWLLATLNKDDIKSAFFHCNILFPIALITHDQQSQIHQRHQSLSITMAIFES